MSDKPTPPVRAEIVRSQAQEQDFGVITQPLSWMDRLTAQGWLRKTFLLALLALVWEWYARSLGNPLVLPTFSETVASLVEHTRNGDMVSKTAVSMGVLLKGYVIGLVLALILSVLAITTRLGEDLLESLTAMLNPLPAIALLPLALIWLGLGDPSIVFVLVHSVMWPVALNTHSGFKAVSPTLRMVGRNYGLSGPNYVVKILVPAALPSILSGLKVGWAFAWRTLIAAELVFGTTSKSGGLGWFIYENKNILDIPAVFAGLFTVILIGLLVESIIFRNLERVTVKKWGMQH